MSVFIQPIYTQTVGAGGAASVTFNNIPQGFTDLKLVMSVRNATASTFGFLNVAFNGSGFIYSQTNLYGNGSNAFSNSSVGIAVIGGIAVNATNSTANTFTSVEYYIPGYTSGFEKVASVDSVAENNATEAYPTLTAGVWHNTSPITSITVTVSAGTFAQNSTFSLYGISERYDTGIPAAPTIGTATDLAGVASVAFIANDTAQGQTADNYSVFDPAIMPSPQYGSGSPILVPINTNATYNFTATARNSLGTSTSGSTSVISYNNYAAITSTTLTNSTTSSIVFGGIPQVYKHLQLRGWARMTTSQSTPYDLVLTVNGRTYTAAYHMIRGDTSSASAANFTLDTGFRVPLAVPNSFHGSSIYGPVVIDIYNYTNNVMNKTARGYFGWSNNSSGNPSGGWTGVAESTIFTTGSVSSITIASFGNFEQFTTFALYGIS